MELSSFEFGLRLSLPIYSRTIVIDRYGVFTALEEDVYELEVMSVQQCAIYTTSFREFIESGKIIGQIGHECSTFV